ncbi:Clavesin-1 [Eumeta japonica]|uniref:Clavesin-1 n=1 Tax=Eumeta variegata TaxID=151549 RepID=A0A4C1V9R7_EUMVA|nr:Clavesin-1 [Eumeta japonica]
MTQESKREKRLLIVEYASIEFAQGRGALEEALRHAALCGLEYKNNPIAEYSPGVLSPQIHSIHSQRTETANIGEYAIQDNHDLLIHQLDVPSLENFSFYDILKSFTIVGDVWLKEHPKLAEGHVVIMDIKDYTLKILPKVNIMFFRDFLVFLLEAMPVRLKQIHVINHPPYVDKLFALVKPVLPSEICELIHFHPTSETLHQFIDKKYLPEDYGGEAERIKPRMQAWIKRAEEMRFVSLHPKL